MCVDLDDGRELNQPEKLGTGSLPLLRQYLHRRVLQENLTKVGHSDSSCSPMRSGFPQ